MKDVVLSLGVVVADGSFLRTGTRAKKSSAGYDLTHMFIGSEGTLGTIVEVALKLSGIPEAIAAGHCSFPSIRAACETTIETIQSGLPIARIELIDTLSVRGFNNYSHTSLPEQPLLLVEFHGTEHSVAEQVSRFAEIAAAHGGGALASATKPEERTKLWQARHDTYWSQQTLRPGARPLATDACVPISRLADCVEETLEDIKRSGLIAPIVGHVGDGNFHVGPLVDMDSQAEIEAADAFAHRLAHRAIAMGGTCTGEHGVGQKKREYMEEEHGPIAIDLMRRVKASFDPQNLFNPGKVFYA
jgi:D-lactate dehydrogenase (cytochrome)